MITMVPPPVSDKKSFVINETNSEPLTVNLINADKQLVHYEFILEPHIQANIVLRCSGPSQEAYLRKVHVDIVVNDNAQLNFSFVQTESQLATFESFIGVIVHRDAKVAINSVILGSESARNSITVQLLEPGAHACLNGLAVLDGETKVLDVTRLEHLAPHCTSEQTYKGILDGQSISSFDGTIRIAPDAQQTSAQQLNRNLLLSHNARAITRPQLEIDADDVKCTHGATVGQLSASELFYLTSRGISPEVARSLLTLGFAQSVLNEIPVASLRDDLTQLIEQKLHGGYPSPTPPARGGEINSPL